MPKTVYMLHKNGQKWYVITVKRAYATLRSALMVAAKRNKRLRKSVEQVSSV